MFAARSLVSFQKIFFISSIENCKRLIFRTETHSAPKALRSTKPKSNRKEVDFKQTNLNKICIDMYNCNIANLFRGF